MIDASLAGGAGEDGPQLWYNAGVMRFGLLLACIVVLTVGAFAADPPALSTGITSVASGDYAGAVLALQPLEAEYADDAVLQYWLGRAYYGQRLFRLAARHLGLAAERDSRNEEVCRWYARALRQSGQLSESLAAYAAYLPRFPQNNGLLIEYASTRAQAGDYRGARESLHFLLTRDSSPAVREQVGAWMRLLDGLPEHGKLDPPLQRRLAEFTLCYAPGETATETVAAEVERARKAMSEVIGIRVSGFRVLLFRTWNAYAREARILLPEMKELHAAAFSQPGLLVLWSPTDWPRSASGNGQLGAIIRHEMIHLAIAQRTQGQGIPDWLNEGLACYFGGWDGLHREQIPTPPLTLRELDRAFSMGDSDSVTHAYAQSYAMAQVLVHRLGVAEILKLLDLLASGTPLQSAYPQVAGESLETFLTAWPQRQSLPAVE